jgi:DNA primase
MSTGRIPEEVIDQVLKQHDIVEVVGRYVQLSKQGHYFKGLCPFHSEKTPSFTVTPEKQIYHCFGCGVGGSAIHFIMEMEGYGFVEAVKFLAEEANISFEWHGMTANQSEQQHDKTLLLKAYELANHLYQYILHHTEQGKEAKRYLKSRGISDTMCQTFQMGYAPSLWDTLVKQLEKKNFPLAIMEKGGLLSKKADGNGFVDKFRERIMFPIFDASGKVIAFGGRAIGDQQPKYMNSPETLLFNKSKVLYHLNQARTHIRKSQHVVLFEGYFDVVKAWDAGVCNGVATMGTALTKEHVSILQRNTQQITICYDGDAAGQSATYQSISLIEQVNLRVKVAVIPNGKDPDEFISTYGPERFQREIIDSAVSSMTFKLQYIRKNFKLQNESERLRYIQTAIETIAQLTTPLEREHYLKQLYNEFPQLSYDAMRQTLFEYLQELHKRETKRDNNELKWNNVRNNQTISGKSPALFPAYHNAERKLLAIMMHDREVCMRVEYEIGDQFNVEIHIALAAYLYSFYSQHDAPNLSRFLAMLQDEQLESTAASIAMIGTDHGYHHGVIDDYIREIKKLPVMQEINFKKSNMIQAERQGDIQKAAVIASEIIILEKKLKSSL